MNLQSCLLNYYYTFEVKHSTVSKQIFLMWSVQLEFTHYRHRILTTILLISFIADKVSDLVYDIEEEDFQFDTNTDEVPDLALRN